MSKKTLGQPASRIHFPFKTYICSACQNKGYFYQWHNYGIKSDFFRENGVIGGGCRKRVVCPNCEANDRIRWIDYVIENYSDMYIKEKSILHIAPEKIIRNKIRKVNKERYITGDIQEGVADYVVDIMDMNYPNEYFDYVILNHVMEHVPDEKKAFEEIIRCLKSQGILMISFPISLKQKTYENIAVQSEQQRLEHYGQKDHCRLYGLDVMERISSYGFIVREYNVSKMLTKEKIKELRVMSEDRIYLCQKEI